MTDLNELVDRGRRSSLSILWSQLTGTMVALQIALIHVPALNETFSTVPLAWADHLLCVSVAAVVFAAVEFEKWLIRSGTMRAPEGDPSRAA